MLAAMHRNTNQITSKHGICVERSHHRFVSVVYTIREHGMHKQMLCADFTNMKVRCRGGRCGSPAGSSMHSIAHKRCHTNHETCCSAISVTLTSWRAHVCCNPQEYGMVYNYARQDCMPAGLHAFTCTASNEWVS